jgi:hypothetical protein
VPGERVRHAPGRRDCRSTTTHTTSWCCRRSVARAGRSTPRRRRPAGADPGDRRIRRRDLHAEGDAARGGRRRPSGTPHRGRPRGVLARRPGEGVEGASADPRRADPRRVDARPRRVRPALAQRSRSLARSWGRSRLRSSPTGTRSDSSDQSLAPPRRADRPTGSRADRRRDRARTPPGLRVRAPDGGRASPRAPRRPAARDARVARASDAPDRRIEPDRRGRAGGRGPRSRAASSSHAGWSARDCSAGALTQ